MSRTEALPQLAEMETLQINPQVMAPGQPKAINPGESEEAREVLFASVRLVPGLAIQLSTQEAPREKLNSKLIGLLEGKSILITTPTHNGAILPMREGQKLMLRTFFGNSIFTFITTVLRSNLAPYPYLHLSVPGTVKVKTVRRATRASTSLIASVSNLNSELNQNVSALIIDLSVGGGALVTRHPVAAIGDRLQLRFRLDVDAGDSYITLLGTIRSATPHTQPEGVKYGIQFDVMDKSNRLVVENYIYRTLVDEQ